MIPDRYLEKVYAGFLGMNIGIRLGAPVEPSVWTYERIRDTYGDIRDYVKPYKTFAADDDANGPVYFLRALNDGAVPGHVTPQEVAGAWLNYAREGVGETVEFGGLLGYAPIMPVNQFSCDAFVGRRGRIPAPIHSFKN